MKKKLINIIFVFGLLACLFFINIEKTKAADKCSCFYSYGTFNSVGENTTVTTESLRFYQIDYTNSTATVKRACGHDVVGNNITGTDLITAIKNNCPAPSVDPIDYNNFHANNSSIVNNCTVENCNSVQIYFNQNAKDGKVLSTVRTNGSVSLNAIEKENFETAVENAEKRDKEANNYDQFDDIDPSLVIANDPNYDDNKYKFKSNTCDIIPHSIIEFLKNFFLIIQVLGIVLLVVMTLIEFVKAITASDDEGLRGAIKNTFRRIIIVVILLLLPSLIIWVLNIVNANAYATDSDGKRVIGADGNPLCNVTSKSSSSSSASSSANNNGSKQTTNTNNNTNLVTSIKLNKTVVSLTKGSTVKLKATVKPSNAKNKNVTWKSSNKKIASVDKNGKVTAKNAGTATITATAKDGSGKKATSKVTVQSYGDVLATAACRLAYSSYTDHNGRPLSNQNGYYGTTIYIKYRMMGKDDGYGMSSNGKPHGCCSRGMATVVNSYLGYDKGLKFTSAESQYHYMAKSKKWKKVGIYKTGMENNKNSILEPGDIVISTAHTCMYVGDKIPTQVYNKYLKHTDADFGKPSKSAVWVSGRWGAGISLCIAKRDQAVPTNNGIIYRYTGK